MTPEDQDQLTPEALVPPTYATLDGCYTKTECSHHWRVKETQNDQDQFVISQSRL